MKPALLAASYFIAEQDIDQLEPFGTGNVNDTFLVTLHQGKKLVLQRVNPLVFPDPQLVHDNMEIVTTHLDRQVQTHPDLKDRFTPLILCPGKKGDSYKAEDGTLWRMVNHVPGKSYETINHASQAGELGSCLGIFHRLLSTLGSIELADTLPGFHHTPTYLDQYDRVRSQHGQDNDSDIEFCHRFIATRRSLATLLDIKPALSLSVIHGDPKVANFVFDDNDRVTSLIDLDTVRNGLLLHDIGDALRSCCNPLGESPPTPENIHFDPDLFAAWIQGYFAEAELLLTIEDKAHIVQAVQVIAFELGLRFVTDHLGGDQYFKTRFPRHNLIRAKAQFRLVQSIEDQFVNLRSIVDNIVSTSDNS